jgi:Eukaryotic aspartyl protease
MDTQTQSSSEEFPWIILHSGRVMAKILSFILKGVSLRGLAKDSIGIIGIGFPQGGVNATAPCWIVEAYKRSIIPAPAYSLSLGRYTDQVSGTSTDGSLLVIGGYDPDLVDGAINWINCSASIHPQIPLDGLVVNGNTIKRVDNKPMQAIIDSGTGGFIPGPSNIVQAVYLQIAGAQPDPSNPGIYVFPCTSTVQIGFQFAGQNYMMNPEDFIMQRQGNQCVGILVGQDFIDDTNTEFGFILGAIFMKNVVTVFDLGRPAVGFGRIKNAGKSYGGYTIIPDAQATALGTGPSASFSATYNPPRGTSSH